MAMSLNKYYFLVRHHVTQSTRRVWQCLPLSTRAKQKIKHRLFRNFPFIFRWFKFYSDWLIQNPPINNCLLDIQHHGSSDPEECSKTLLKDSSRNILVVSHDAQPFGGEFLALGMVRALKQDMNMDVKVVLLGGGSLKSDFVALAPVYELNEFDSKIADITKLARSLVQCGFNKAIVNTTVSGWIVPVFSDAGIECICLVHELPGVIRSLALEAKAKQLASSAKAVVFQDQMVADGFAQFANVAIAKQVIRPQGLYRKNKWRSEREAAGAELRKRLGLPSGTKVVLAVGQAAYRKGVDIFVECAFEI